jgi:hypothetical protein
MVLIDSTIASSIGQPFEVRAIAVLCNPKTVMRDLEPATLTATLT